MENKSIFVTSSLALWFLIFLYWIIRSKEKGILNEIAGLAKLIVSGLVLYIPVFLQLKIFTFGNNLIVNIFGLVISIFGLLVCIIAREYLSKNWSGKVTVQEGHNLIKNGPYKIIRHPIYSGILIMMFGSGIIAGFLFGFLWVLFCFFGLYRKSRQEEILLENKFGSEYEDYKKETKMMIPKIL